MFLAFIKTLLMQIISNVQHQEENKKIISLILHRYWSGSFVSTSAPARMFDDLVVLQLVVLDGPGEDVV